MRTLCTLRDTLGKFDPSLTTNVRNYLTLNPAFLFPEECEILEELRNCTIDIPKHPHMVFGFDNNKHSMFDDVEQAKNCTVSNKTQTKHTILCQRSCNKCIIFRWKHPRSMFFVICAVSNKHRQPSRG